MNETDSKPTLNEAFKNPAMRRALIISICNLYSDLGLFNNLVGVNLFVSYYYELAKKLDFDDMNPFEVDYQLSFLLFISFLASTTIYFYIDSKHYLDMGRKNLLLIGSLGMATCYIILIISYGMQDFKVLSYCIICVYLIFYQTSIGPVL